VSQLRKNSELALKKLDSILAEIEKQRITSQEQDKLIYYQELARIMAAIVSETVGEPESSRAYVCRKNITNARDILRKLGWTVACRNGRTRRPPIPPKDFMKLDNMQPGKTINATNAASARCPTEYRGKGVHAKDSFVGA
jgi:hypothetical protein